MANSLFNKTPRLMKAVELMNSMETGKLGKIIQRIINSRLVQSEIFSKNELVQLVEILQSEINLHQLSSMIDSIKFIFQQAAFYNLKSAVLKQHLLEIDVSDDVSEMLAIAWGQNARATVEKMKQQLISTKQLDSVEWNMNIRLSGQTAAQMKDSNVYLHMNLLNNDTEEKEKLLLEFDHSQLLQFYQKLETIQSQLDSLT